MFFLELRHLEQCSEFTGCGPPQLTQQAMVFFMPFWFGYQNGPLCSTNIPSLPCSNWMHDRKPYIIYPKFGWSWRTTNGKFFPSPIIRWARVSWMPKLRSSEMAFIEIVPMTFLIKPQEACSNFSESTSALSWVSSYQTRLVSGENLDLNVIFCHTVWEFWVLFESFG